MHEKCMKHASQAVLVDLLGVLLIHGHHLLFVEAVSMPGIEKSSVD